MMALEDVGGSMCESRLPHSRRRKAWIDRADGAAAPIQAGMQADAMLDKGDIDGQRVWLRILKAVEALLARISHHDAASLPRPQGRAGRAARGVESLNRSGGYAFRLSPGGSIPPGALTATSW